MTDYHYVFSGVVYPERAHLELGAPIQLGYRNVDFDVLGNVQLSIYKNQIILDFTTANRILDILTLRNLMTDFVASVVDIAGFSGVVGYEVDLRSVCSIHEQTTEVFGVDIPGLSIRNDEIRKYEISDLLSLCGSVGLFRRALSDFKNAIRHPIDTGFFCYRAIESILNYVRDADNLKGKPEAINRLNDILNLDPTCIELVRDLGGDVRHGKIVSITGSQRHQAIRVTREILQRFVVHLKSGPGAAPDSTLLTP